MFRLRGIFDFGAVQQWEEEFYGSLGVQGHLHGRWYPGVVCSIFQRDKYKSTYPRKEKKETLKSDFPWKTWTMIKENLLAESALKWKKNESKAGKE